jgi:hypothetical protein
VRNALNQTLAIITLLPGLLFVSGNVSQAFEKEGYNTPDTISQQVSPGAAQESYNGVSVDGTKLYATLTSRFRLRTNERGSDQEFYQYLRARTDGIKLGHGTVKLSAYARFARDLNGDFTTNDGYSFYRDALATEVRRDNDSWSSRLYLGEAVFDNVIKNTTFTLGRTTLTHLNEYQLDGGDATVKLSDQVSAYVYGGRPVSFYYRTGNDYLTGGGVSVKAAQKTTIGGEYTRFYTQSVTSDYGKLRINQDIPNGNVALVYSNLDNANMLNADIAYELKDTGTIITAGMKSLFNDISKNSSYVVNDLSGVYGSESRYNKYELGLYQAFMKHFAAGITFQERLVTGPENSNNRSYERLGGKFDIFGIPTDNTYLSLTADYWGVRRTPTNNSNDSIQYGATLNQKFTKTIDAWVGTAYNRYDYDQNSNIDVTKQMVWARSYFVGGQYKANKFMSFKADVNMEHGSYYNSVDNNLNTNYTTEIWANFLF